MLHSHSLLRQAATILKCCRLHKFYYITRWPKTLKVLSEYLLSSSMNILSSLSRHADTMDSLDYLAIYLYKPSLLISHVDAVQCLHRADELKVFLLANKAVSMCSNPQEKFAYEFALTSVPRTSCSSYLDGLRDDI